MQTGDAVQAAQAHRALDAGCAEPRVGLRGRRERLARTVLARSDMGPSAGQASTRPGAVVVEGDRALRRLLTIALERCGMRVGPRFDDWRLEECLNERHAAGEEVTLLVADIDTPGGASPTTIRRIRRRWPDLTVVLLTALGDAAFPPPHCPMDVLEVLEKPIELSDLYRVARDALGGDRNSGGAVQGDPT